MAADISDQCAGMLFEQNARVNVALMGESRANGLHIHQLTRQTSARKFNEPDPIEAAAVEMILSGGPVQS